MIDSHPHDPTYEPEVLKVVLIAKPRVRVDLEGIVVSGVREGKGERERERE